MDIASDDFFLLGFPFFGKPEPFCHEFVAVLFLWCRWRSSNFTAEGTHRPFCSICASPLFPAFFVVTRCEIYCLNFLSCNFRAKGRREQWVEERERKRTFFDQAPPLLSAPHLVFDQLSKLSMCVRVKQSFFFAPISIFPEKKWGEINTRKNFLRLMEKLLLRPCVCVDRYVGKDFQFSPRFFHFDRPRGYWRR